MYCVILASCILQVCARSYSGAAENVTVVPFVSLNAHILDYSYTPQSDVFSGAGL